MIKKYCKLKHLFSCYFHQDMGLDYANPEEALKGYAFQNPNDSIKLALDNIQQLKAEHYDAEKLWTVIGNLGCEHRYDEYAPEEWLDYVSNTIKKYLAEKESLEPGEQNGV